MLGNCKCPDRDPSAASLDLRVWLAPEAATAFNPGALSPAEQARYRRDPHAAASARFPGQLGTRANGLRNAPPIAARVNAPVNGSVNTPVDVPAAAHGSG